MTPLSWVRTPHGEVCTQGAHVTRWRSGGEDVLFLSAKSRFEPGQAIRGGVPVIFPWFGDDPEARGRPAHGFARRMPWRLLESTTDARASRAVLELVDDEGTRALWPQPFALRLEVWLGDELELDLRVENRGELPLRCETALHTYLRVGDVRRVVLRGLEGAPYRDKLDDLRQRREGPGPLVFSGETDRIYPGSTASCRIEDPLLQRTLVVAKQGSRSSVVWNPWSEKGARLADLDAGEWPAFLCVESGNLGADALELAPGAVHGMQVRITRR